MRVFNSDYKYQTVSWQVGSLNRRKVKKLEDERNDLEGSVVFYHERG
jgi:hypothetical protein